MLEADRTFSGSVPENYNRYMVPLIFEVFATELARRASSLSPATVLETAAGTGVVSRVLGPQLSVSAKYIVTDLNQSMLNYAMSRRLLMRALLGCKRMHWICRLEMETLIWSAASSAQCFFQIASPGIGKQSVF